MRKGLSGLALALFVLMAAGTSFGTIIDFTGGTVYMLDGSTAVTGASGYWQDVDYYIEDGFKLDFIGVAGNPFSYIVGDYYSAANDVIHGHWDTGGYGDMTEIVVTKTNGDPFDLNYFILTSNTDFGGDGASGNEQTYIHSSNGFSLLLPSDDWGFSGSNPQVFLDSNFDGITSFSFTASNYVDCFGMDNFYIDQAAPTVPEPASIMSLFAGLALLGGLKLRRKE